MAVIGTIKLDVQAKYQEYQDLQPSFLTLLERAGDGDAAARYEAALSYRYGVETPPDSAESVRLMTQAALQGLAPAQYMLGRMRLSGVDHVLPQDESEGVSWLEKAAGQGHVGANLLLGSMYLEGRLEDGQQVRALLHLKRAALGGSTEAMRLMFGMGRTPLDEAFGLVWLLKAGALGDREAARMLARGHLRGEHGLPVDARAARKWLEIAAAQRRFDLDGEWRELGRLENQGGPPAPPAHEKRPVHERTFREALKAAQAGDARAQYELALLYQNGVGTPESPREGLRWFARAAAKGLAEAQFELAFYHLYGDGVEEDAEMAAGLLMRAAEGGHVLAQILTASNCLDGWGGLESVCGSTGPTRWIKLAAYQNWPKAMIYLATVMKRRDFRGENQVRGMIWLNMAAEEGDPDGQYELAKVFLEGSFELGVSSDREMGERWLEIAAGNGSGPARERLKIMSRGSKK